MNGRCSRTVPGLKSGLLSVEVFVTSNMVTLALITAQKTVRRQFCQMMVAMCLNECLGLEPRWSVASLGLHHLPFLKLRPIRCGYGRDVVVVEI